MAVRELCVEFKSRFEIGPGAKKESQSQISDIEHSGTEFCSVFVNDGFL